MALRFAKGLFILKCSMETGRKFRQIVKGWITVFAFFLWEEEMPEILTPMVAASPPWRDTADSGTGFEKSNRCDVSDSILRFSKSINLIVTPFSDLLNKKAVSKLKRLS